MLTELSALLDLLKAKGVSHYVGPLSWKTDASREERAPVELTLAPAVAALPDDEKDSPQDMCKCGHELAQHQGGLCMHGCDEEKCS